MAAREFTVTDGLEAEACPRAAVAVMLAQESESVLLIRRAERVDDPWSGHIGLPGGRTSPSDADLLVTAMRETTEEVGVRLERQ
ncbi:MAG: NUDIX domain-containing protein, partial [Gemmatimonadota bacterium]|nr:NUDIX domain-containing protein [Gemmatimonadota bacterium]